MAQLLETKPEETKRARPASGNGFFRTGDIGYQDANGYFYILDRLKDMIVTAEKMFTREKVEAVIYTHPAVREVAVLEHLIQKMGRARDGRCVLKPGKTSKRG